MNKLVFRTLAGISVAGTLAAGTGVVHAQQNQVVQARVISATPIRETTGSDVNYNVTYEYNGRQYTTRMNSQPGATIPIQASGYGVTTSPVAPQSQVQTYPVEANNGGYAPQSGGSPWDNVVPEPGVVVSNAPAPVYSARAGICRSGLRAAGLCVPLCLSLRLPAGRHLAEPRLFARLGRRLPWRLGWRIPRLAPLSHRPAAQAARAPKIAGFSNP